MTYRVVKQQPGTRVALALSRLGPDHGGVKLGHVIHHVGNTIVIVWDNEPEFEEHWRGADAKYEVDRGLMRFTAPPKKRRLRLPDDELQCKVCGAKGKARKKCPPEHRGPGAVKPEHWGKKVDRQSLTSELPDPKITRSRLGGSSSSNINRGDNMAEVEMISAKQAAIRLGTDARTIRKFLRSEGCTFEAVGQGGRYEFTEKQMKKLKKEFDAWGYKAKPKQKTRRPVIDEPDESEFEEDEGLGVDEDQEWFEEPDDDDLEAIELEVD